jgi:hypothetical protein
MKRDKLLEQAISEAEAFLLECKAYQKRINKKYRTCGVDAYDYYDDACIERGTLKARSLLLIRKLQSWRKCGNVE